MALLPDLETAEQAYERGWNDARKAALRILDLMPIQHTDGFPASWTPITPVGAVYSQIQHMKPTSSQ